MTLRLAALVLAGGLAAGCTAAKPANQAPPPKSVAADLLDAQSRVVAHARVTPRGADSVAIAIDATDLLAPGPHGVHIHAVGRCDPPAFTTAGPHLNPGARKHGLENPEGPHAGDMPNLEGTHAVLVAAATMQQIADSDGSAIVIHATKDDQATDPSGSSGARVACGVISPPVPKKPSNP